ncbi:MAG: hypothetical protein M0P13_05180 [Fibrobacteraceae bacterium]|nr:hypothetical protein [Fibrobacteraceae bacterium]
MKKGIAYFGVRDPGRALEDLWEIKEAGFTHVLHTWSEEDELYYSKTMAKIIEQSTAIGLQVYVNPWGVGRVFGGEAYSELTARNHDLCQVSVDGKPAVAACPNHPEFREYMHKWILSVCHTEVETIFWDEPHFYFEKGKLSNWACRCPICQKKFKDRFGFDMPKDLTPEVKTFRENSLVDFLAEMTGLVHTQGKRNSVCMLPPWFPAGLDSWDRIAELASVDEIACDPYWERSASEESISKNYASVSKRIFEIACKYGKEPQMWIKNYQIEKNRENDIAIATQKALEAGVQNIFAWSFKGNASLSWLASDDPETVWQTQIRALKKA